MKSYTDIEQSKKLAEILPIESADSHYVRQTHDFRGNTVDGKWSHPKYGNPNSRYANYIVQNFSSYETIPCWSTSALLEIIRNNGRYELQMYEGGYYFEANGFMTESYFNPIDACYEMILKLHEQNLL